MMSYVGSGATSSGTSSSYRDRTAELISIAERLRKTQGLGAGAVTNGDVGGSAGAHGPGRPGDRPGLTSTSSTLGGFSSSAGSSGYGSGMSGAGSSAAAQQSEFAKRASRIGLSIHETSKKLQKLAKLAKRTSMFDDPTVEIQDLTAVIKQDITALNVAIADLQALREAQADGGRGGGGSSSKHSSEHSSTVVDDLKTRLMSTTKEFKDVLTMRTENLKVHENRRQLFSATSAATGGHGARLRVGTAAGAAPSTAGTAAPSWIMQPSAGSAGSQLYSSSSGRGSHAFDPLSRGEQSQALVSNAQDTYMASRSEALQNVETTIVELGNIFRDLATMVAQQGEMAIRIDQDMEDTLANVEGAQGALLKYLNNITSNRALIIKIFFVLLVFLLIFVFFVA